MFNNLIRCFYIDKKILFFVCLYKEKYFFRKV